MKKIYSIILICSVLLVLIIGIVLVVEFTEKVPEKPKFHLKDLEKKLKEAGHKLVVIEFLAIWCGPCKVINPKFDEMSKKVKNVVFIKVDVDESQDIAEKFHISAMPEFYFMKNMQNITKMIGSDVERLQTLINKYA